MPKYNLETFFQDQTDDIKLLANISNDYSKINSFSTDKWASITRMVLSDLHYGALMVKYRYLIEDDNKKNFPFIFEKKNKLITALSEWVKI